VEQLTTLLATIEVTHDYAADDLDATLDAAELATPERLAVELKQLNAQVMQAIDDARRTAPLLSGITIAICGPPNVGKSTLFNALLGTERALTGSEPGTTRDYLAEQVEASGLALKLVDTAGYRSAADAVEAQGVRRAGDWARAADCLLWVEAADMPRAGLPAELAGLAPQHVITRCDLLPEWPQPQPGVYHVSGRTGQGLDTLWQGLAAIAGAIEQPALAAFTQRQAGQLATAQQALSAALSGLAAGMPLDAVAADLYTARRELHAAYEQEDRGAVVAQVFSRFCVGK
jgi:tRNA modification GTPase